MNRTYHILHSLLKSIEAQLTSLPSVEEFAESYSLSCVHLNRMFRFAFGLPLASYMRSRRLAASLNSLLDTKYNVLDIAVEYGFGYEQSYIRAFKKEFDITPGEFRRTGQIVKVTPPLQLVDCNLLQNGIIFGPDIVMVPQFHVIGKMHSIPYSDSVELPPKVAKEFWNIERPRIRNTLNPNIYFGLTRIPERTQYSFYLPSVQTKDLSNIPDGLTGDTFPSSLCVRFHYIGQHHYNGISADVARGMYDAIITFVHNQGATYGCMNNQLYFEKIDTSLCDETYCQMEWFTPIYLR